MFVFNSLAKRRREEDEVCGLEEHESKRLRPDPLVSSPSTEQLSLFPSNPQFLPRSLSPSCTPIDSSDDEAGNENDRPSSFRPLRNRQSRRPPMLALDTAIDVDMADPRPLINGDNLSPWPVSARSRACGSVQPSPIPQHLINQSLNISGGRTGHFTLNMRPDKMMGDAGSFGAQAPAGKSPGPQTDEETDWWRRRRLLSPISESGDAVADLFRGTEASNEDYSSKSASHKPVVPDSPPSMDVDNQCPSSQWSGTSAVVGGPVKTASDPVVKRNAGSGKGKVSFSMGYRADCEKCRLKVPGHYSHIIRS